MKTITKKTRAFSIKRKAFGKHFYCNFFFGYFRAIFMAALAKILNCTLCRRSLEHRSEAQSERRDEGKSIKANKQARNKSEREAGTIRSRPVVQSCHERIMEWKVLECERLDTKVSFDSLRRSGVGKFSKRWNPNAHGKSFPSLHL